MMVIFYVYGRSREVGIGISSGASSMGVQMFCDDANIVVIKASLGALTNDPCILLLNLALCSSMIVH
jgi:hypothetical protein